MTANNYLVLARKWRPRTFETLVGQEHVVKALSNALSTQRLHHAWLFTGTRGVGKTTLARILAKSLNCEQGISAQPCGVCQACTEIDQGRFVDYLEFDAASNRRVEEMTQLLEQAIYAPSVGRFKIYTIDEVHMLTGHAFNAMLKTLEEPPPHVKFILATTDPQKIPVTVLSRCLQFNLKQMPPEYIVSHLQNILGQEGVQFENEGLRLLAQAAAGSMRDALSLTDQAIAYSGSQISADAVRDMLGTIDQRYLIRFLQQLLAGNAQGLMDVASELTSRGFSFSSALEDLASLLSRIAIEQRLPGTIAPEDPAYEDMLSLAHSINPDVLQLFYSIAIHSRAELALSPDEYTGFVMAGLRMLSLVSPVQMRAGAVPLVAAKQQTVSEIEKKNIVPETATPNIIASTDKPVESTVATTTAEVVEAPEKVEISTTEAVIIQATTETPTLTQEDSSLSSFEESHSVSMDEVSTSIVTTSDSVDDDFFIPHDEIPVDYAYESFTDELVPFHVEDEYYSESHHVVETDTIALSEMSSKGWINLVKEWKLTGIVGEIARQSEWVGVQGSTVILKLNVRLPDTLQAKAKLATILTEYFKTIVKLELKFGDVEQTAHVEAQRELQQQQQAAEQAVLNSEFVQTLQKEFQAEVIPDSIRPYTN